MISYAPSATGWPNDNYYAGQGVDSPTFVAFFKSLQEQFSNLALIDGDFDFTAVTNVLGRNALGIRASLTEAFSHQPSPTIEVWGENESGQSATTTFALRDFPEGDLAQRTQAWLNAAWDRMEALQVELRLPIMMSVRPPVLRALEPSWEVDPANVAD